VVALVEVAGRMLRLLNERRIEEEEEEESSELVVK
jgi:hypothetical protein